jgi:hypothetical protein
MRLKTVARALLLEAVLVGGVALLCEHSWAQTETTVPTDAGTPPTLTAIQPVNPVGSKPGAPLIQSITAQVLPTPLGTVPENIRPQFHFVAANGNAVLLHMAVLKTSANNINLGPATAINVPAEAQKTGAVISSSWRCNLGQYYVTMTAYIMDADGNKSNEVQYTVHCNGG